jgi:hypothetical protein
MKKRIIYTLLFLMAAGWLVKDDLPFLRMTLCKIRKIRQNTGTPAKYGDTIRISLY